jgi:chemotaxis protein MotB
LSKYGNNKGGNADDMRLPTAPGWMVTYGDLMGLLLTFFVLFLSYSTIHEEGFREALESFRQAVGLLPYSQSMIQFEKVPGIRLSPPLSTREIVKRLRNSINAAGLKGNVNVREEKEGVRLIIQSPILFDSGKADLRPDAQPLMDELIKILKENPNTIVIEGHTDNIPINTPEFPSNWELSTARAISVAKYLFEKGNLEAKRFTVAGYGEYHPVESNDTPEGRQKNRRVEILLKNIEGETDNPKPQEEQVNG